MYTTNISYFTMIASTRIRILGLDPGYHRLGYAVLSFDGRQPNLETCGCITTSPQLSTPDRLAEIYADAQHIVERWEPTHAVMEKLFFAQNTKTALGVGEARGVLLALLGHFGIPVEEISPNQMKRAITGYGHAKKPQIQMMVTRLLGLTEIPQPDDAADAIALALTATQAFLTPTT